MPPAGLPFDALWWLFAAWLFLFGAVVGSFLNVVIYRLPARMSIVRPGSHCPLCSHAIRWYDNIPVLGWIVLGGRCRDCRAPISMRYPLVEALTGAVFLLVGAWGAHSDVPGKGESLAQTLRACHLVLLCTLLATAMIQYDGKRPPWRLFAPALLVATIAAAVWPALRPVPVWHPAGGPPFGIMEGLLGLAAGGLLGWGASLVDRRSGTSRPALLSTACIGLFLGWQAVAVIAAAAAILHLVFHWATRQVPALQRVPLTAWLTLGTLVWILVWANVLLEFTL
jgi:leader peptidase (prepilin peptidase) / N-methyltransferase